MKGIVCTAATVLYANTGCIKTLNGKKILGGEEEALVHENVRQFVRVLYRVYTKCLIRTRRNPGRY